MEARAVVLCSGGLDSTTVMAAARAEGSAVYALTVDYGQRHRLELEAARRVAEALGAADHRVMQIDLRAFGGSALTGDTPVPHDRDLDALDIPVTYVPARNTIFLSLALAYAEVVGASSIWIGVNALDYSGYPDCRPEFIAAFEKLANLATRAGVTHEHAFHVRAPLIDKTKAEIIRWGVELGVDYGLTHSCYDPTGNGRPCGTCDSCRLRLRGFAEAGLVDPLEYA